MNGYSCCKNGLAVAALHVGVLTAGVGDAAFLFFLFFSGEHVIFPHSTRILNEKLTE